MVRRRGPPGRFYFVGGWLAIDFANTIRARGEVGDGLGSWGAVVAFLAEARVVDRQEAARLSALALARPRLAKALFTQAVGFREALRRVLAALETRSPIGTRSVDVVNRILRARAEFPQLTVTGRTWTWRVIPAPRRPLDALLPIARSAADLIVAAGQAHIRKCANPQCVLYFDAGARPRRRWCAMSVCGNRMKVAAFARRRLARRAELDLRARASAGRARPGARPRTG